MGSSKFRRQNKNKQNQKEESEEASKLNRIQKQIQSDLSPKYTEMKKGARTSRFGRPQKETPQDINSIPTDVAKFVSKHSPKRLKPKETNLEDVQGEEVKKSSVQEVQNIPFEDKENFKDNEAPETVIKKEQEDHQIIEQFSVIKEEDVKVESSAIVIDEKVPETYEENVEVFKDVLRKIPSEDGSSKQDFSDTDSALGNDIKNNNGEYVAGQILWGSFSRLNWFPCMAYPYDEEGSVVSDKGKVKQLHVKYFNWNGFTAFLPIKNAFEFKDIDDFFENVKALDVKKQKIKAFSKACYKAMEEANFFKKYALEDRVRLFDDILKYQVKNKMERKSIDFKSPRSEDRKSIDSAVETGTAPSSPVPHTDPIEHFLKTMDRYEAFVAVEPKKEKKTTHASTPKPQPVKVEEVEVDINRRKSGRVVKKRKFEDYVDDKPQQLAALVTSSVSLDSPSTEPKKKRPKIMKEETLEERFLVSHQDLRVMFQKVTKKRACMECFEVTAEITHRCIGHGEIKCAGWFHESCAGHFELKREEIRHQCGDSDEIIQTNQMKPALTCKQCIRDVKNCFACYQPLMADDATTHHCPNQECRLSYHKKCLELWPQTKVSKGNNSKRNNLCPQHTCHTCFSKDIHNTGPLVKCLKCPAAYHLQLSCIPAGTKVISQSQVICPRHPTDKEKQRNAKEKNSKPLNIDWCNFCMESGSLVCCESCPSAFHPQCINYVESDENFNCVECQEGRLPLYNTIVWARVGTYRWWPGLIMPNHVVPELTLKSQKNDREFCIRFFGSYDFFWFSCERVFNYDGTNLTVKSGNSRLDSAFNTALTEAHVMAKLLGNDNPEQMTSKPKPFTKLLTNRPIPPVRFKKIDEHTQEKCACRPDDPNPCGRDSDCINMSLHFECNKLTCPAGIRCQNQKLRNREYAELKIIKTNLRGFGAVTVRDLSENTFVVEYVGDLINTAELNRRMDQKLANKEKDFYFLTIESDLYVDAEPAGNKARFINHSCNPNCYTQKITVDGNTRIGIFSNQFIPANTELTFDYQMEFVGNKKTACFCGMPTCSGLIGEKPKEEKRPQQPVKKKAKKRSSKSIMKLNLQPPPKKRSSKSIMKLNLQPPPKKRRGTFEDSKDPIEKMLERMPEKSFVEEVEPKEPEVEPLMEAKVEPKEPEVEPMKELKVELKEPEVEPLKEPEVEPKEPEMGPKELEAGPKEQEVEPLKEPEVEVALIACEELVIL